MITMPNSAPGNEEIWDPGALELSENNRMTEEEAKQSRSLYVEIFESMQNIVLKREKFLFSEAERTCLERLKELSYPARYLLIRLCLCKRDKWHTLGSLERYTIEIGDKKKISDAIDELCGIARAVPAEIKKEEPDVIDLTMDDGEETVVQTPMKVLVTPFKQEKADALASSSSNSNPSEDDFSAFAADDTSASLLELLACLPMDDLKLIGKQMKVTKTGQTRPVLIDAILSFSTNQSTLAFPVLTPRKNNSAKAGGTSMHQLTLSFGRDGKKQTQTTIVRQLISKVMGRCVKIAPAVFKLFDRLNLVFFRSTNHSSSLLLPALLTAFRKRQYNDIDYVRSATIFRSRQALLDYEEALALEARVDEFFGGGGTPVAQPKFSSKGKDLKGKSKVEAEVELSKSSRIEAAEAVRTIWESIYDRWKALVACKDEEKVEGLERFDCAERQRIGYILTRIVYKGAQALSILKEYDLEMEVLEALLAQTKWRQGRRGAWYDRLALVLMTHCEKSEKTLETAMDVVIRGLEDDSTHLIYRPRLERRLTRLEKMLKIPMSERHKCDAQLKKAKDVFFEGLRVPSRAKSVVLDTSGRMKSVADSPFSGRSKSETPFTIARSSTQPPGREANGNSGQKGESPKGRTRWIGRQGAEVSVEQLALEHYEDQGFKGFHSEGSIISTIFGLLFWDVIFAPVPGAFETPYQSAPLDIHEDSFYSSRKDLISGRLRQLEDGDAREVFERIDDKERPRRTWCIGVNWGFERQDLVEILDCIGGHALAIICQMICEDYGHWRAGVPDLFIWKAETKECRFVEVKSPNDTLQENQKVWIDVLIGSQTSVDLCHVCEKGMKKKAKKPARSKKRRTAVASSDVESEDEVELDLEDDDIDQLDQSEEGVSEKSEDKEQRIRDSDDYLPPTPIKRRKTEVEVVVTRKRLRKS